LNNGRFEIDFTDVSKEEMIAASVRSANASNDMLEKLIKSYLVEHKK
jgi:cell filamentation protein